MLQSAPYNLLTGQSIFASVSATNKVGTSNNSTAGNGATLFLSTVPSPPTLFKDVTTSRQTIKLGWNDGSTGGQPIIDYKLWFDQGLDTN